MCVRVVGAPHRAPQPPPRAPPPCAPATRPQHSLMRCVTTQGVTAAACGSRSAAHKHSARLGLERAASRPCPAPPQRAPLAADARRQGGTFAVMTRLAALHAPKRRRTHQRQGVRCAREAIASAIWLLWSDHAQTRASCSFTCSQTNTPASLPVYALFAAGARRHRPRVCGRPGGPR